MILQDNTCIRDILNITSEFDIYFSQIIFQTQAKNQFSKSYYFNLFINNKSDMYYHDHPIKI